MKRQVKTRSTKYKVHPSRSKQNNWEKPSKYSENPIQTSNFKDSRWSERSPTFSALGVDLVALDVYYETQKQFTKKPSNVLANEDALTSVFTPDLRVVHARKYPEYNKKE